MAIIHTTMTGATRRGHSVNGNPRWTLQTDSGEWLTQTDAGISYEVDNLRRRAERTDGGLLVALHTTRAGRVFDIHPMEDAS